MPRRAGAEKTARCEGAVLREQDDRTMTADDVIEGPRFEGSVSRRALRELRAATRQSQDNPAQSAILTR
jgi:hypothetical protein